MYALTNDFYISFVSAYFPICAIVPCCLLSRIIVPDGWRDRSRPEDLHRIRVEHMERQLANLTGLVQKALTQNVPTGSGTVNQNYLAVPGQYRGKWCGLWLRAHTLSLRFFRSVSAYPFQPTRLCLNPIADDLARIEVFFLHWQSLRRSS